MSTGTNIDFKKLNPEKIENYMKKTFLIKYGDQHKSDIQGTYEGMLTNYEYQKDGLLMKLHFQTIDGLKILNVFELKEAILSE